MALDTLYCIGLLTTSYLFFKTVQFSLLYLRPSKLPQYLEKDSWALVTGASDGIGLGFAEELCQRGFNVIIHGRNPLKLQKVKEALNRDYPSREIRLLIADALATATPLLDLDTLVEPLRRLNFKILVNNIGGMEGFISNPYKTLAEYSQSDVEGVIAVNIRFTTHLTRILLPTLTRNHPALIMNISSAAALGLPYLSVYSASKAYIDSWTRSLKVELRSLGHDVETLGIVVGAVNTPRASVANKTSDSFFNPSPRVMASSALDRVGCGKAVLAGYFPHALLVVGMALMPEWMADWVLEKEMRGRREFEAKKV